jgi:hypothetical protein
LVSRPAAQELLLQNVSSTVSDVLLPWVEFRSSVLQAAVTLGSRNDKENLSEERNNGSKSLSALTNALIQKKSIAC